MKKRLFTVDWIRAWAILLMVFTHTAIFYDGSFVLFSKLGNLGGIICFTFFLFAFGATLPILIEKYGYPKLTRHLLQRAGVFYIAFVVLGVLYSNLSELGRILVLQSVPEYSDFILAFVVYFLIAILLIRIKNRHQYLSVLLLSIVLFFVGQYTYLIESPDAIEPIKMLVTGQEPWHAFPIFQYLIVMVLGFGYGRYHARVSTGASLLIFVAGTVAFAIANMVLPFERWQVTPTFMLFGLTCIALAIWLAEVFINKFEWWRNFNVAVSKRASGVLVLHLAILIILRQFNLWGQGPVALFLLFLFVMGLSWWGAKWIKL